MSGEATVLFDNQNYHFDQQSIVYSHSQMLKLMTDSYIADIKAGTKTIDDFYKTLQKLSVEDARSLLYINNFLLNKSRENISYNDGDFKSLLTSQLKTHPTPVERYNFLVDFKAKNVLPESYLDWFKNDLRCSLFLMGLIQSEVSDYAYKGRKELISGISNLLRYHVSVLQYALYDFDYKKEVIRDGDLKTAFLLSIKSTYLKGRTKDKEIKWLDASNHEQVEWAYSYLANDANDANGANQSKRIILNGIFFPETIEEKYELILAHLDTLSNIESPNIGTEKNKGYSERSYTLYKMRKAWDGQKNYGSKSKESDGIIRIYKKNQAKLDRLIAFSGFTAQKMINNSIEQMYDQLIRDDTETVDKDDASG